MLTLRRTGLSSPAYRDWLDYVIVEDGRDVGRVYEDRHSKPELMPFYLAGHVVAAFAVSECRQKAPQLGRHRKQPVLATQSFRLPIRWGGFWQPALFGASMNLSPILLAFGDLASVACRHRFGRANLDLHSRFLVLRAVWESFPPW
jgi:hypothetical protein